MIAAALIAAAALFMPVILLVFYAVGIQHERGGLWRVLWIVYIAGLPIDVVVNYVHVSALYEDRPERGEWTLSKRLPRLNQLEGWRGRLARSITRLLDWLAPSGQHIKVN